MRFSQRSARSTSLVTFLALLWCLVVLSLHFPALAGVVLVRLAAFLLSPGG